MHETVAPYIDAPCLVMHMECGLKALLQPNGVLTFWRRWNDVTGTYVEVGGPL